MTPAVPATSSFRRQRLSAAVVVSVLICATIWGWRSERHAPPAPAVFGASTARSETARCSECHADITERFAQAPHSRTLYRGDSAEALEHFAGRSFQRTDSGVTFQYRLQDRELRLASPAYSRELPITWLFGSGTHAQTPLITWTDDRGQTASIEHAVSWYPADLLGVTLGQEAVTDTSGVNALGRHWPAAETANCFGCHSTHVPLEQGRIDFDRLEPNISCVRCHVETERHLQETASDRTVTIERLGELSPLAAVERCGECHRRASELGGEILPDDPTIVRFAPVGLVQSPCFQQQVMVKLSGGEAARLDCASCHNPHQPAVRDWQHHVAVCLTCHDSSSHRARDCTVATRTDNCLPCHMPAVAANDNLKFTDHWIRRRKP